MRVPFVTEKVLDMIIRCMRTGNYITNDADVDKIRTIANDATESYMNSVAASLHYGTVPSSDSVVSNLEDVNVFVDSDDTNPTTPYINYFRIAKGQMGMPITEPYHELLTVGTYSQPSTTGCTMRMGPSPTLAASIPLRDYPAILTFGCKTSIHSVVTDYGFIAGLTYSGDPILEVGSINDVFINVGTSGYDKKIVFGAKSSNIIGWMAYTDLGFGLSVGGTTARCASFERTANGAHAYDSYAIRLRNNTRLETLYLNSSYPNNTNAQWIRLGVGGSPGIQNLDPAFMQFNSDEIPDSAIPPPTHVHSFEATCLIVTPDVATDRCALFTRHQATSLPNATELVAFDSEMDCNEPNSDKVCLLRVTLRDAGKRTQALSVRGDRSIAVRGTVFSNHADVAEVIGEVPDALEPGTVVSIDEDGTYHPSGIVADPHVVGIVTEEPAMLLGRELALKRFEAGKAPLAIALTGTVWVKCTTACGPIKCGSLLVSYPDGMACLAPEHPSTGSVIAKALEPLSSDNTDTVTGKIKVLVFAK